ncbi:uncharacterized protein E5676_scaffold98G002000 [Cucumis melo var. makuwa]|uniref:Uncharacterized protein n=1 Tax=Cucumis melo var. makuwa TaxID=1194695 RepID=A0A5D3C5Q1_CUCMM|nr:uncharacterized protein E5676_scaffold98G002000 [Cucumis melo var. makuwa]
MIILEMNGKFPYPSRMTRRGVWVGSDYIIRDERLVRSCKSRCRLGNLIIRSGLGERKKVNRCVSEERLKTREGGVEGGQARKHSVLPKCDMARYTKSIGNRTPTTKTFMFYAIVKKITEAGTWFKFSVFMRMQENKASTTKDFKGMRQKEEGHVLSQECGDVCAQHVYFVEKCGGRSAEQEFPVGREQIEECCLYTPRHCQCEGF